MKGQPKSTRKNSILYSLWKVLQFLFLFAPVGVVFLCSFVNLLPGNTINKMLFKLNFVLLHDIHLPTIFKSTELQYELPTPQWHRQDSLKRESDAYVLGGANDLSSRNHVGYKNACKKFNCCGEAFVCALCMTGFGKSNDDDDDCALMEYREKHLKL